MRGNCFVWGDKYTYSETLENMVLHTQEELKEGNLHGIDRDEFVFTRLNANGV